jgi:hypothetical protein
MGKTILWLIGIVIFIIVVGSGLSIVIRGCSLITGAVGNAGAVVQKELYPSALLKKYEWFKDASAQLDKKVADINIYETKIQNMKKDYSGQKRSAWDRTDKENMNIWEQELAGIKASYNGLSAEYNAQMSKINWAFCNRGTMPANLNPLPREYKPYQNN